MCPTLENNFMGKYPDHLEPMICPPSADLNLR